MRIQPKRRAKAMNTIQKKDVRALCHQRLKVPAGAVAAEGIVVTASAIVGLVWFGPVKIPDTSICS